MTSTYLTNAGFDVNTSWVSTNVGVNPSSLNNVDGWTKGGSDSWSACAAIGFGTAGQINGASIPNNNSDGNASGGALAITGAWDGGSGYVQYTQNVTLPAGMYELKFKINNVGQNKNFRTSYMGFKTNSKTYYGKTTSYPVSTWTEESVKFELTEETTGDVSVGFGWPDTGSGNTPKLVVDYVQLLQVPYATDQDIEALNTAISKAGIYVIGFAQGEYAPYANVAAISALKTAKEISATAESGKVDKLSVTNATTALSDATWTVNAAEMNAVYDGTFALTTATSGDYTVPTGWTNLGYNTRVYNQNNKGSNSGVDAGSEGACLFAKFTTTYGEVEGYEMPLKTGSYKLTFIYGGWNELGTRDIKVYDKENNSIAATVEPNKVTAKNSSAHTDKNAWSEYEGIITIPSDGNYVLSFYRQSTNAQNQICISDIELKTVDLLAYAKEKFAEQQTIAQGYLDNNEYAGVTGSERTDLQTKAADLADDVTLDAANTSIDELKTAITAFTDAKDTYAKYDAQTANAKAIGVTDEALTNARPESASDLQNALNRIIVLEDQAATTGYTQDATNIFGTWTQQNTGSASGQHWSDDSRSYIDKNSNQGFTMSVTNTVTLPAGKYVFKAAARCAVGGNNYGFYMSAKIGDKTIQQNYNERGDSGYGIDTDGKANYSNEGTYCNDNNGRGWEWRFIGFSLDEETEVEMKVYAQIYGGKWVSFTDITLLTTDDNEAIVAQLVAKAKEELQGVIDAAPSETTNVGTGAFQIPAAAASTYATAKNVVQAAHDAQNATLASIADAKSTFETAINTFRAAELNAPEEEDVYNLALTDYNTAKSVNNVITFKEGNASAGGYAIGYTNEAGSYLNQGIHFAKTSEANTYNLYIVDADGNKQYICVGSKYDGGNNNQIRMTDDSDKALAIKVEVTTESGIYNLRNTITNTLIGSNGDAGMFTANAYNKYTITDATKTTANLKITTAKYGTFIAPFAVELPDGVTAYSVEINGTSASLNKIAEGGETLPANTPAVVYSESEVNENVEGWGLATAASYTNDNLTGVYALTAVTANTNNYMLQNGSNGVAFYLVNQDAHIGANRCYIHVDAASPVKAFFFNNIETAISEIATEANNETIYDLSGRKVAKAQKGLYIINGKKVIR